MRRLGKHQREILQSLLYHGPWHPGCGWTYNTISGTIRLLDSLRRRGLVENAKRAPDVFGDPRIWRLSRRGVSDALDMRGAPSRSPGMAAPDRGEKFSKHGHSFKGISPVRRWAAFDFTEDAL